MKFLGSVKLDKTKRVTLIKEVADILQIGDGDHVVFYFEDGDIIIRKVLPNHGDGRLGADEDFMDWVRRRRIEISMMDPAIRDEMAAELNDRIESYKDYLEVRN